MTTGFLDDTGELNAEDGTSLRGNRVISQTLRNVHTIQSEGFNLLSIELLERD